MLRTLLTGGLALALVASAPAQVIYDGNANAATDGTFSTATAHGMQIVTTSAPANVPYLISQVQLGIRFNSNPGASSGAFLTFYTGVDTSPTATDALATATQVGSIGYSIPAQATGSYLFTLPNVNITVPTNVFAVEIEFTNAAGTAYSTALGLRLNTGPPAVGSNDGFYYADTGPDGIFQGSERRQVTGTSGSPAPTDIRFNITAAPVPEPSTLLLMAAGIGGLWRLRRKNA